MNTWLEMRTTKTWRTTKGCITIDVSSWLWPFFFLETPRSSSNASVLHFLHFKRCTYCLLLDILNCENHGKWLLLHSSFGILACFLTTEWYLVTTRKYRCAGTEEVGGLASSIRINNVYVSNCLGRPCLSMWGIIWMFYGNLYDILWPLQLQGSTGAHDAEEVGGLAEPGRHTHCSQQENPGTHLSDLKYTC